VISRVSVPFCLSVPLVLSRVTRESTGVFKFTEPPINGLSEKK
jgi:hypothetical protein